MNNNWLKGTRKPWKTSCTSNSCVSKRAWNSFIGSSNCFLVYSTNASTDLWPRYSLFAGWPFRKTFKVGYLVIWNLEAKLPRKRFQFNTVQLLFTRFLSQFQHTFLVTIYFAKYDTSWFGENFFYFLSCIVEYWFQHITVLTPISIKVYYNKFIRS